MIRLILIYILTIVNFFFFYIYLKFGKIDTYLFETNFKIFFLTINQENISHYEKLILKNLFQNIFLIPSLILLILLVLKKKNKKIFLNSF